MSIDRRLLTRVVARLAGLLAAAVLPGCGGQAEESTAPQPPSYAQAKGQWARSGSSNYRYLYTQSCFCPVEGPIDITVRDGRVVGGVYQRTGQAVPAARLAELPTLDGLFAIADEAFARGAARVEFRANAAYGYLERLFIDYHAAAVDDEVGHDASGYAALPG